ncbi:MAG: TolC family protein [Archangium sp.]|nr:TolC family protein [Archangium sp.]MDP3154805.1 TolC family protein [Archangium sp.]MDP3575059.1 TolC family protein [Archangium sp.]
MSQPLSQRLFASITLALISVGFPSFAEAGDDVSGDAALRELVQEALQARSELAQLTAQARAAQARVPQAEAWPEPMLQVGVQNDSFKRWQVGTMETSWVSFMASQTFPFPGKLGLRGEIAQSEVRTSELAVERVRLSTIAEVRRGYLSLQLIRERSVLLERLIKLSGRVVEVARLRSLSGMGSQSEVLRAQVELSRVTQRGHLLAADEALQVQRLNQLRRKPLDTAIETGSPLSSLSMPELLSEERALELGRQRSPELLRAQVGSTRAQSSAALARRSYFPDVSVSAGVMLRGRLEPMWALNVGVPLPVFAGIRQARAVEEASAQGEAALRDTEAVEQQLVLRAHQRAASMKALRAVWRSYQDGLLVQAAAAAESTMSQYAAGQAQFAAVLEANALSIAETEASLEVLASAWRLVIAQDELSPGAADDSRRVGASTPSPSPSPGM